jgi:hypothetical protein
METAEAVVGRSVEINGKPEVSKRISVAARIGCELVVAAAWRSASAALDANCLKRF